MAWGDAQTFALGSAGEPVVLWDLRAGLPIGRLRGADGELTVTSNLAFRSDARGLAFGAGERVVLWQVDLASWRRRACELANRNLTSKEWEQAFGSTNTPYKPTCLPKTN